MRNIVRIQYLSIFFHACLVLASIASPAMADVEPEAPEDQALESCPGFGRGFIRVPASETCVKIGAVITMTQETNFAKADLYAETLYLGGNPFVFYDLVPTALLPSKVELQSLLSVTTASTTERGPLVSFLSFKETRSGSVESLNVEQAFIALGGFTVGRRTSFFDFSTGYSFTEGYASNTITNLAANTWNVGQKGSVTVSLEDNSARRVEDGTWALRGSHELPSLVVAARVSDQRWGSVQISAAIAHITDDRATTCCGVPKGTYGWAVSAGLEFRTRIGGYLGRFIVSGAYSQGAVSYLGQMPFATDYIVDADASIARTTGFSLMASYEHVWRNDLKSTFTVSAISTRSRTRELLWKPTSVLVSAGIEYMPAPGFMVGVEGNYYVDMASARYFGVDGETSKTEFGKIKVYVRRQL